MSDGTFNEGNKIFPQIFIKNLPLKIALALIGLAIFIALLVFMFIKIINTAAAKFKREEGVEVEEVEIPAAEQYLKDIRDLLAKETIPTDLP